uniref:DDE Tnp4 domain-containing protein n=1 Tax=Brassica oleracea var. oleracea TaxID=109376 RepID=A0A0D3D3D4_BRAOL
MSSSSSDGLDERIDELVDEIVEDYYNDIVEDQPDDEANRAYIERDREGGDDQLWNDYFSEDPTYSAQIFRRRFRMKKNLFLRIVRALKQNFIFFQQRKDATGRWGLSSLQKCTAAIRLLAYGTLNDINVLDRSPVFDDILEGRAPRVRYMVNGHMYKLAYYLTDGIYPKWSTFIQSITLPQCPKQALFAKWQEAARKDVERAFGVLQARFAIVKNPVRTLDIEKIGKIMRACIILHNMIVEDERDGYTNRVNISDFQEGESSRTSEVLNEIPTLFNDTFPDRNDLRDRQTHDRLKNDLIENIWNKFGNQD